MASFDHHKQHRRTQTMKTTTKDNAPRVAELNEIDELFKVLFGGADTAGPRRFSFG